jgi:hypothetical protein
MIIYNVTIKVTHSIHTEWLEWLKDQHIPEVINTGCFTHAHILKLLEVDELDGPTYAIQYFADSKAMYNLYIEKFASTLRQKSYEKWGNNFIAFRSVMHMVK